MPEKLYNLEQLLDRIEKAANGRNLVSLEVIIKEIGSRSFGPLMLMVGIILASPLSGIPGMPTTMGLFILLVSVQLLFRRESFWLPRWLLKRSVEQKKLHKALAWLRPPASFIDRWIRPRLTFFIRGISIYFIAFICFIIAIGLPVMELVPFSATTAGAILAAFGLSMIAHDGFLALLAFILTIMTFGWIISTVN
jgi:hypothetical protein